MAELQQMGALDPAARDSLMADLKQTDPALWPLMIQQFRAYAAYRRQAEQRDKAAAEQNRPTAVAAASQAVGAAAVPPASVLSPVAVQRPLVSPPATAVQVAPSSPTVAPSGPTVASVLALPSPLPARRPLLYCRRTAPWARRHCAGRRPARTARWFRHRTMPRRRPTGTPTWPRRFASWKRNPKAKANSDAAVAQQAYLRMLYLLAGRRNDALSPIPGASQAVQDYWSKQLYGLATWLDTDHTPDGTRRAAETKRILTRQ